MTGYASTASAVEALRLGANDYLEKPFEDVELVVEKVSRAIENQLALGDRALFLRQVLEFRKELQHQENEVAMQQSQIGMFNEILERRVQQATSDLRRERDELAAKLTGNIAPAEGDLLAMKRAKTLLEELMLRPDVSAIRGELQRALRELNHGARTPLVEPAGETKPRP